MTYIHRENEEAYLKKALDSEQSETILLYGRRRLGKTTLIKNALPKNSTYFLCTQESSVQNLSQFKELLAENIQNPLIKDAQADSWTQFFFKIKDLLPKNHILAFDEFPYLVSKDSSIASQFQKIIDEYLRPNNCSIILCGSSTSVMKELQEYQSPLYGRRTKSLHLKPFKLKESISMLKPMPKKEAVKCHLALGGIPYYFEQIDTKKSFDENINELFFTNAGIFIDEPQFLLQSEFKEVQNYLNIIKTIAKGKTTFSEISDATFIEKGSLSKYLSILEKLHFVEHDISYFAKQNSKKTRYNIADNFMYFFYAIQAKKDRDTIIGNLFEREVRKILTKHYPDSRKYFKNTREIDVLYQSKQKHITCVEIKMNGDKTQIQRQLQDKTTKLPQNYSYTSTVITFAEDLDYLIEKDI